MNDSLNPQDSPLSLDSLGDRPARRRSLLVVVAVVAAAMMLIAGCGGGDSSTSTTDSSTSATTDSTSTDSTSSTASSDTVTGNGYAYPLPAGWTLSQESTGAEAGIDTVITKDDSSGGFTVNINVVRESNVPDSVDVGAYVDAGLKQVQSDPSSFGLPADATVEVQGDRTDTTLAGDTAPRL